MNKKKLFTDNLKYILLNALKHPGVMNEKEYIRKRQLLYSRLYKTYQEKKRNEEKISVTNLYAILYSKYYSQRYVIQELKKEDFDEDDEAIKQKFKDLLDGNIGSSTELENKYLAIISDLKSDKYYNYYKDLNERMISTSEKNSLTPEETELFLIGTSETDIFLEKKINEDLQKFRSTKDNILLFLQEYRFVNGWITAAGIFILTSTLGAAKFFNLHA